MKNKWHFVKRRTCLRVFVRTNIVQLCRTGVKGVKETGGGEVAEPASNGRPQTRRPARRRVPAPSLGRRCQPLFRSYLFYKSRRERSLDELISIVSPELQIKSYIARGNGVNRSHFSPSGERYEVLGIKVTLRTVTIIRRNG